MSLALSRFRVSYQRGEVVLAWAMVSPWLAGFMLLTAFPMIASLVISFFEWNLLSPPEFIGLAHYKSSFSATRCPCTR